MRVRYYVQMYFKSYCGAVGLPRGHVLSAVLAEIAMRDFDHKIRNAVGVYRYYRYSDDILLFAFQPPAEIISLMTDALPTGLSFNASKSDTTPVACFDKTKKALRSFEYLGYKFSFSDYSKGDQQRAVHVSIADRKIAKLKTRIILSLKSFKSNLDTGLLRDRLRFLSGNYRVQRTGLNAIKTSKYVKSGIFYSYKLCGKYSSKGFEPHNCDELKRLDGFYSSLVNGSNSEFTTLLRASFPQPGYDGLRSISFFKGFLLKHSVRFNATKVHAIKSVWRNA